MPSRRPGRPAPPSGINVMSACVSITADSKKTWRRGGCSRTAERIWPANCPGAGLRSAPHRPPAHGSGRGRAVRHLGRPAPRQRRAIPPHHRSVERTGHPLSLQADAGGVKTPSGALPESADPGAGGADLAGPAHRGVGPSHSTGGEAGRRLARQPGGRPLQSGAAGGDRGGLLLHQLGERPGGAVLLP